MDTPLRSVQRAMQLLEALGRAPQPRPLHALSEELGLGKATVRRFLLTLQGLGYVDRDARGAYRLTEREQGRLLRERSGVSLRQMAEAIGTNPGELSRWERGIARPRTRSALRWIAAVETLRAELPDEDPAP